MRVWTKEHGFPVIRVSESRDASGKVTGVRLFRQRFLTSGVAKQEDVVSDTIYPLRFTIRHRQDVETVDMNTRELVLPPSGSLFKVNADHGSFFRTSYSHKLLTRPLEEASKGSLSLRDGIGLLSIQPVYKFHGPEPNEALRKLTSDVIDRKGEELGWTISKHNDENLDTIKTSMCSGADLAGYPSVVSTAKELFTERMAGDENAIPRSPRWATDSASLAQ
ncbi:hypothetical protein NW765_015705 [Fusarium oxysporum]|uniref:Uncharacterized protein n=1 Tax=Fusarium oxysporum Fo47 TaxID=660027 RepID=W9KNH4_FUSOX|nr:hypothetical protein FOZG_04652 [Fusarium oxysporum Fo47]EWZ80941.1 hypothetical protein FOWG_14948 [Fusarium oxysporum f. sp. lycopersici MN25]KAJ4154671.1 hypothetical protein NW765_015705 [Fusarium oxysporum]KAJ4268048.1 hypothetical protein NW764_014545 [Fusarium oxysporum]